MSTVPAGPGCPCSIWPGAVSPQRPVDPDTTPVELGVKFRTSRDGVITGIRFYKGGPENAGPHEGHLWAADGTLLGSVAFTGETDSGWQQATLATPVSVTAGVTYVASYFAPAGRYAVSNNFFTNGGVTNGPLTALQNGVDGGNGVYRAGSSGFPTTTYLSTNYWVDVLFDLTADSVPPTVVDRSPAADATGVSVNAAASATLSEPVLSGTVSAELRDPAGAVVASTGVYDPGTYTITVTPAEPLAPSATYTITVNGAKDPHGNQMDPATWSFSTAAADTSPPVLTSRAPVPDAVGVPASAVVVARLSEPVQPGSLTAELRDAGGVLVPATTSYETTTRTLTLTPNQPLAGSTTHTATVTATDLAGNPSGPLSWSFTTAAAAGCPCTIWPDTTTPGNPAANDTNPVEVGVKFRADTAGYVTGVRFYKGAGNDGTHIGNLWTSSGSLLASGTFTGETAQGWQQLTFPTPVPVMAGATYVASYYAPSGHYAADNSFFTSGVTTGPLTALADGVNGGNGVYRYGAGGGFPTATYQASNYWVDVVFDTQSADLAPPGILERTPASDAVNVAVDTTITARFDEPVDPTSLTVEVRDPAGGLVPGTIVYSPATRKLAFRSGAALATSATYTVTVRASDAAANAMSPAVWSFTTAATATACPCTIWGNTAIPATPDFVEGVPVELGVKFRTDRDGYVKGVRFYKGPSNTGTHIGHLWTAGGQQLAAVTFTAETASGWQQALFATPVAVSAGTTYVVSYLSPNGGYAIDTGYFATQGTTNGPLTALADGADGGNGVFAQGPAGGFPAGSYQSSNYWVDVVFDPAAPSKRWVVDQVIEPGSNEKTSYLRDGSGRVTRLLAPLPDTGSVSCPPTGALNPGCRALEISYATGTTATGADEAGWGDYAGRVTQVAFTGYDPDTASMRTVAVSAYLYDATGRLRAQWDPRVSPALQTRYAYDAAGRVTTVTPPGLQPWNLGYDSQGRLAHVTRTDPVNGAATQAVAYDVPFTGPAAPVDLSLAQTAAWAQTVDLPRVGAAVFPASHLPPRDAASGAYTPGSGDWEHAELTYLDANGRAVNTAGFGAGAWQITTSRYDKLGNTTWSLAAGNRAEALSPTAGTDPFVAARATSAERADLLATTSTYNADSDLLSSVGPTHPVMLESGDIVSARAQTTYVYDEGKPDPTQDYHLVTTTTTEPLVVDGNQALATAADARTTKTGYDPTLPGDPSGWTLKVPTSNIIVMPGGTDIVTRTRHDSDGRVVETRQPKSDGTDAGTTITVYYTAAANTAQPRCGGKPEWDGLTCLTGPKAPPSAGPQIPTEYTTYTLWGAPATVSEETTTGTVVRTSTTTYDAAGRVTRTAVAAGSAAPSTPVPDVTTIYDSVSGLPTELRSLDESEATLASIVVAYNTLGRATSYTDASGNVSTFTYDIDGRVATAFDGQGTVAYTYDGVDALGRTERRGLPTTVSTGMGSAPSSFLAAYDPDESLIRQVFPNGLIADYVADATGGAERTTYSKDAVTWLEFTTIASVHRQTRQATGANSSSQAYTYDHAGRLVRVEDTYADACATHEYTFDSNSNRIQLTDHGPDEATGACTTATTPVVETYSYDTGDRITNGGYAYDLLGRSLTIPGTHLAGDAELTATSYATDMPHILAQEGITQTFTLDPAGRYRTATRDTGERAGTVVNHYDATSDSPAWIAEHDGTWTRYVAGLTGDLAAIQRSDGTVGLQLANLHGDIVATVPDDPAAVGVSAYFEHTEYGIPRAENASNPDRYGWLGGKRRSSDAQAGLMLMGARLYNPRSGLFLSADRVRGGNPTSYGYPADPIGSFDLSGLYRISKYNRWWNPVAWIKIKLNRSETLKVGWGATSAFGFFGMVATVLPGWAKAAARILQGYAWYVMTVAHGAYVHGRCAAIYIHTFKPTGRWFPPTIWPTRC